MLCVDAYTIYFGDYWNDPGLEWYLNEQFGDEKLKSDLKDKNIDYHFIWTKGSAVGFIKVNNNPITNFSSGQASELEKMYILPKYQSLGIGKIALTNIVGITRELGKKTLFLDVLDSNKAAIAFYNISGFKLYSKKRLKLPYFKDEYRGLHRMFLSLRKDT